MSRTAAVRIPKSLDQSTKEALDSGHSLPLMEAFYTLQGEGMHAGKAAYFIRVGGCDVGCHWCDVKESWDAGLHPPTSIEDIVAEASKYPAKTIVITGGEPLMWNLDPLCNLLKEKGFEIHLETSGAYELSGSFDWICLSPKRLKPSLPKILELCHELKVIVYNKADYKWAETYANKVSEKTALFLQPEWSKREEVIPTLVQYIQDNPKWMASLQTHKYLHIP